MSTGSPIEIQKSQSPEFVEVPPKITSDNETAPVQVIPLNVHDPVPKMISREETSPFDLSRGG